jgi:thioredoxin reductase
VAVDTPAKIAILGAGPIGLEAALYARYLGYEVEIFERGDIAENVLRWGHVRMFSPFRMNSTPLGLAAIQAQDDQYDVPGAEAILTGKEWRDRYLVPLAQSDLLIDHLRSRTAVVAVARQSLLKYEKPNEEDREESPFRILCRDAGGDERDATADIVIDTTGTYSNHNWLGPGGAPAVGERSLGDRIRYDIPDIAGAERTRYAHKRVLVIGHGHSAATTIVNLASLADQGTPPRVTWVTRAQVEHESLCPIPEVRDDPLPERVGLARAANSTLMSERSIVTHWPGTTVSNLKSDNDGKTIRAEFVGRFVGVGEFDEIIANVGYRPDNSLYSELQVHECYASGGPMRLAAKLLGTASADCLGQTPHGSQSLVNPEPNFYILGAKSYGRRSNFLFAIGIEQIREVFSLIGDREDLNLYSTAKRLIDEAN